ncbi:hypothetical protein AVEN_23534-1 [Araneus ventricosus]|uniref:Uncharacterized protein n=1 Tax=Araneus ventricosus TaxID=182803 RepID=A0A4Y2DQ79_ARAVE|nr:hypothetical protein AVEN_23534-1 [Araneus ventricosus]
MGFPFFTFCGPRAIHYFENVSSCFWPCHFPFHAYKRREAFDNFILASIILSSSLSLLLWIITMTLRDIVFVGHVHWFQCENGIRFPAEIGVSEVLPFGIPEDRRRTILTSVDNTGSVEHAKDRPVNRVASRNISHLSFGYKGIYTKEEAERLVVRFVQDKLVAVKGLDQKIYFESLGLTVVDIKTEVLPCCPKYENLPDEVLHPKISPKFRHSIHYRHDDSKCSRIIAIGFFKYVEIKRRDEPDKYWDDQAESFEWDEPSVTEWDNEWDDEPIALDEPANKLSEPKQHEWDDEPIIEKDVIVLNLKELKNSVDTLTVERGNLKIIINL